MSDPRQKIGAIDVGGTKIGVGLVSTDGQVLCRSSLPTAELPNSTSGVKAITSSLKGVLKQHRVRLSGIGIGCTGPVNPFTGVIGKVANLPGWEGCALVDELSENFGTSVVMENDADAAALAEAAWGGGRGVERFLYITISTGIGCGFLLHGKIYRGAEGAHPEMGHHVVDPSGPACYCGATGCWESLASGLALKNWFLQNDPAQRFAHSGFDAAEIFNLHAAHDSFATQAIDRLGYYVGLGLANLTTILLPEVIAIGGGLAMGADSFLSRAIDEVRRVCGEVPAEKTLIRTALLAGDVGLAGAAAVWIHRSHRT